MLAGQFEIHLERSLKENYILAQVLENQWVETQLGMPTEGKADKIHLLVIQFGLRKVKNVNPEEIKIH